MEETIKKLKKFDENNFEELLANINNLKPDSQNVDATLHFLDVGDSKYMVAALRFEGKEFLAMIYSELEQKLIEAAYDKGFDFGRPKYTSIKGYIKQTSVSVENVISSDTEISVAN